jgi:hypothetical protein
MLANFSVRMILMGLAVASLTPATLFAQTPPPKNETELVAAGNKPLAGQQISALVLGNTAYIVYLAPVGTAPAGTQITAFYRDARIRVVAPRAGSAAFKNFEAKWWIEGNQLCHQQVVAAQGTSCSSLYQTSSAIYLCKDGNCRQMWRIVPGNPEKL